MTKEELLAKLAECAENSDTEIAHVNADEALLAFINDSEITKAFDSVPRWYA